MTRQPSQGDTASTVEAALHTYPLTPVPPQLRVRVMQRIAQLPHPRFQLTWLDYALTLFGGSFAATPLIIWQTLTPQMIVRIQITAYYFNHLFNLPYWFIQLWGA